MAFFKKQQKKINGKWYPQVVTVGKPVTTDEVADRLSKILQSPNQKIPDRKTKCVIKTHINIKQNVIFSAKLKPV